MANNHQQFKVASDMLIACRNRIEGFHRSRINGDKKFMGDLDNTINEMLHLSALYPYELATHSLRSGKKLLVTARDELWDVQLGDLGLDNPYLVYKHGSDTFHMRFPTLIAMKDWLRAEFLCGQWVTK